MDVMMLWAVEVHDERHVELPRCSSIQDRHRYSLSIVSDVCITCRLFEVLLLLLVCIIIFGFSF